MKALEMAGQAEKTAGNRLDSDLEEWALSAEIDLRACAKELRRLAVVEAELERIKALEPVAWLHIPKVALDGKVRPVASTERYEDDYGAIYSERIPLYALGSKT